MDEKVDLVNDLEMPEPYWFTLEEAIQRLRKTGMLEWILHFRPTYPTREHPEDAFQHNCEKPIFEGSPSILESSITTLPCRLKTYIRSCCH